MSFRPFSAVIAMLVLAGCAVPPAVAAGRAMPAGGPRALAVPGLPPELLVDAPAGPGPHPLLVIAPAKEYTMSGAIFERLAKGAAAQGFYAVRFNWRFKSAGAQPSADLAAEARDLDDVIGHFAGRPEVDRTRVVLAAKSFGSKVAMRGAFRRADALLLLTPNGDAAQPFELTYAPLVGWGKPIHVVIAATDPYGDLGQIYAALPRLGRTTTLTVLPAGDHNFREEGPLSAANEWVAIDASLNWLAHQAGVAR